MAKIREIRIHVLAHTLAKPFQSSFSTFTERRACLVAISTDDGLTGWGECLGPAGPNAATVDAMAQRIIGWDASRIEAIWQHLFVEFRDQGPRGITITALSGIDIALWDLAGKRAGLPVHALMGASFRQDVPAYATGGFRKLAGDRAARTAEEAANYVDEGFGAVKIKIGYGVAEDLSAIEAVRAAIGAETALMIDANHGYDAIEAIELARGASAFDIGWFEEPVVPEDLAGYREIRRAQPIPVAAGETWHTRWAFRDALVDRCVDIVQPDVCGTGGLTEARKIADLASAFHIRVVPHVWGSGIAVAAALQFLATLPPAPTRHAAREPMLEFDRTDNPFQKAVLKAPIVPENGRVSIPDGPGLGIEVDIDGLARFAAAPAISRS